VFLIVKSSTFP